MSFNYSQLADQFDDPYIPQHQNLHRQQVPHHPNQTVVTSLQYQTQSQDNLQYGMQKQKQQRQQLQHQRHQQQHQQQHQHQQQKQKQKPSQFMCQDQQPQHYVYQSTTHQTYQQHESQPPPLYSQLGQPPPLPPLPLPLALPLPQPPIQPHQNDRDPQQQLPRPTDPRNSTAKWQVGTNSNKKVPPSQNEKTRTEKNKKQAEKRKKKKEKKRAGITSRLDSGIAEFAKAHKVSVYSRCTKKNKIPIPLLDKYHGKIDNKAATEGRICIAYQCLGVCQDFCKKKESHRKLSKAERQRFYNYLTKVKGKIEQGKGSSKKKKGKSCKTAAHVLDEKIDKSNDVEPGLAVFGNAFKLSEYHSYTRKFGMKIPQLDDHHNDSDSRGGEICLIYHCKGQCSKNCSDNESHRPLLPTEQKRLRDYLFDLHCRMVDERDEITTIEEGVNEQQEAAGESTAAAPGRDVNVTVDSSFTEFAKAHKVSIYNKTIRKYNLHTPLIDKYRGMNKLTNEGSICITYHCLGGCRAICKNKESHRKLSESERQRFYTYLKKVKGRIEDDLEESAFKPKIPTKRSSVDPGLAVFVKDFKLSSYFSYAKKFGMKIPQLDDHHNDSDSREGEICLIYHCKGLCCENCSDKESHRKLLPTEQKRLHDYMFDLHCRLVKERGEITTIDEGLHEQQEVEQSVLLEILSNSKKVAGRMTRAKTKAIREIEKSIESCKRKADDSEPHSKQSNSNKRQRVGYDDERFDDCSDDDEVRVLGTIIGTAGTPTIVGTPSRANDGTALNPVDLTDSVTPMARKLYAGLPSNNSSHITDPQAQHSMVSASSGSTRAVSIRTASSDDDILDEHSNHKLPPDIINSSTFAQATSLKPNKNRATSQSGEIPKLSLSVSSDDQDDKSSSSEASTNPINSAQVDQMKFPEQPQKEGLTPNTKSRKLKKLRAQLALAKKQHELAMLKEGLRQKDQELQEQRNQESNRPKTLAPISAFSTKLIIENIHESGPENMVFFPNFELDHDLQLTRYKAILNGDEEGTESLSARKMQIEQDLAVLKERLESSLPTVVAESLSREDLQRKLEEAQANKDLSYWKLFVSKQEHILSNVEKQIQENATSLEQSTEMESVERESREALKTIKVLKIREATLTQMAAKSSMKILQMRQRLHQEQTKVNG
ncbi:MAG: hypothetical protein SGBAC_001203 [Bacillariaceae sp.]